MGSYFSKFLFKKRTPPSNQGLKRKREAEPVAQTKKPKTSGRISLKQCTAPNGSKKRKNSFSEASTSEALVSQQERALKRRRSGDSDAFPKFSEDPHSFQNYLETGTIIKKELGFGAFGVVLLVEDKQNKQKMALKIMNGSHTTMDTYNNEVKVMAAAGECEEYFLKLLNHSSFLSPDQTLNHYLLMEHYEGRELFDFLGEYQLEKPAIQYLILQFAEALSYLNSKKIIHRDLKPENALIDEKSGRIKIIDFGFSMIGEEASGFAGTFVYAAPEVHLSEEHGTTYGPKVDVYSLGIILYEIIHGQRPDEFMKTFRMDPVETDHRLSVGDIVYPPEVDPDATDLMQKMLNKVTSERPSPNEILNHPFITSLDVTAMRKDGIQKYVKRNCYEEP